MLKQTLQKPIRFFLHLPMTIRVFLVIDIVLASVVVSGFFIAKPVTFSYNGSSCVKELTVLPGLNQVSGNASFNVERTEILSALGLDILSLRTCFTPIEAPKTGSETVSVAPFGGWLAKRSFTIIVEDPPTVNSSILSDAIPTARALKIPLNHPDKVFEYAFVVDEKQADCATQNKEITCDIASLDLAQGKEYIVSVDRLFEDKKVETVIETSIKTLVATTVEKTSIKENQTIYDKPKGIVVTFDKPLKSAAASLVSEKNQSEVEVSSVVNDTQMTITFDQDLDRQTKYKLIIDSVEAQDGSTLIDPYQLHFSTSGGPKVSYANIGSVGVALAGNIVITFDQAIDAKDAASNVTLPGFSTTISTTENQIILGYSNAEKCKTYTVTIDKGLPSKYGIPSDSAWSYSFRTVCHSTSTIGYSAESRAITAYTFGSGSTVILYTGTIHGNELGAKLLLEDWIDELEANAEKIPANRKIVIVPALNPDGVAKNSRYNAHTVDLNRNFDTSDWQKDIVTPTNEPLTGGGGSSPLSEPESKAIASLTSSLRPRLTMSFHGVAGYVIGNQGGDSAALAAQYASLTGYSNQTGQSDSAFSYEITGTYDDWIKEELGQASVLVELNSNTYSEFSTNRAALWAMLNA